MHLFAPMGKTPPIPNFFGMMAGTTRLELATSAVTGQRSNQLNYVPNRGINDLAYNRANKGFARFAYSALIAWDAPDCRRSWQNLL